MTCKYFQLLSQRILWKIPLQWNYLLGPGRRTQKTSFSEAENVIYFPSAMVSKVKIPLIGIDFCLPLFFFSFLYFRWLIFIHTFSREGVKGLPPASALLPTSSSRINYVSSTSFFLHCNEIQARNKPPQIEFICCVNSFFICIYMSARVFYILLVWIWGPIRHICLTDEHIAAGTSSACFVQQDIPLTPVFILCCTAALSMWLGMLANRTVKEGKSVSGRN